jgi:hypothetical protein
MPGLVDNKSDEFLKILFLGDPGAGKTGALTSLVNAGYQIRIADFDNLLGSLKQYVLKECPGKIGNVSFQTFTDKMKGSDQPAKMIGGVQRVVPMTDGQPKAFVNALKQLTYWKTPDEDLGDPGAWGANTVLVVDSLTSLSSAAYRYAVGLNPDGKEGQAFFYTAQQLIRNFLALLCSEQMRTNVIVIAHVEYRENHMDLTKGFPKSVGKALNEEIAGNFNSVLLAESKGSGSQVKRVIRTNSTGIIDLKNPVAFKVPAELPLETGLADFFQAVKG